MLKHTPLWDSPHRLFFLMAACFAMLAMALWLLQLAGLDFLSNIVGGALLWHAHEMAFGFSSLAVIGFLLTAVPEFTRTAIVETQWLQRLALIWLAGRGLYLFSAILPISIGLAALADTTLLLVLLKLIIPPLWRDPARRHLSLAYAVGLLGSVNLIFYLSLGGPYAYQSLMLLSGTLMILVLLALARISMSVVNDQLGEVAPEREPYIARPPRRNLAILCISLYSVSAFWQPASAVNGWLALACAAAVLNILNDWHVGTVVLRRWVLIPYALLWAMAVGYALQGVGVLTGHAWQSAGQHLLLALSMTLAILYVLLVAGGNHSGWGLDWRRRPMVLLACFAGVVTLRSLAIFWPEHYFTLLLVGGLGWIGCWALLLPLVWRTLLQKPAVPLLANEHCKA